MMKRLVPVIALLLLLAGCNTENPEIEPTEEVQQTVMHLTYCAESAVEKESDGTIKMYEISQGMNNLELVDDRLLLVDEQGKLLLIDEEECIITASDYENKKIIFADGKKIVAFVPESRKVIVWDNKLNKTADFVLEEGITGEVTASDKEVYYCVNDYIRALNMETGLSRNVMQYIPEGQTFTGTFFDGQLIGWRNGASISLISSADGQVVLRDSKLKSFVAGSKSYFGIYRDGIIDQNICGFVDGDPMQLVYDYSQIFPQLNCDDIVTAQKVDGRVTLQRFNMDTGDCIGSIDLTSIANITDVVSSERYTWIIADEQLYRWDYSANKTETQGDFTQPMVTEDNPDVKALADCEERAKQISERYGIDIHIWQDAIIGDEKYSMTAEYQVDTINKMLDNIDAQLSNIPEQLLHITDEYCGIQICLVRSIQDNVFVQYLSDTGFCIAITPEANIEEAFLTGLGWGIDSCIIGNSRDLDYWDDLNPAGFSYDYDYYLNEQRTDLKYLEGENKAFVDKRAMSFPSEDRARIFYYAMTEGNEALFASPVLQVKLKTFCEGIREAYGWQKDARIFPWEQYLEQSLAYNK